MRRYPFWITFLLVWPGPVPGQQVSVDPPSVGRPADFSNVVGKYERPRVHAKPTAVRIEEPITVKITIAGIGPREYEPNRRHLRLFPESFEDDFFVQEMPDEHKFDPLARIWTFVYRLRPKHIKVTEIDGIRLTFYNPDHPGRQKFLRLYAEPMPIPIKVKPKGLPPDPKLDVETVPATFYEIADARTVLASPGAWELRGMHFAVLILFPPVLGLAGAVCWRRRRSKAGQRRSVLVTQMIERLKTGADPRQVVLEYLSHRGLATLDPTPAEASAFLKRCGHGKDPCDQAQAFFEKCDAERFGRNPQTSRPSDAAIRLLKALEADQCA